MKIKPCWRLLFASAFLMPGLPAASAPQPLLTPVLRANFPDPFIISHNGEYIAYATNTAGGRQNVQMARSRDLVTWEEVKTSAEADMLRDAMPVLPSWARRGFTWAPEVLRVGNGYILYFTARHAKSELQCVGAASSDDPLGPFTSTETEPLVCQYELGGTIDASPFRDLDGQLYLYFKNDGNHPSARKPTELFAQRLTADGLKLHGERVALLRNDQPWEGHVIEAPTMVRNDSGNGYTMFYAANDFGWREQHALSPYATGYATCASPMGPCTDAPDNPLLHSAYGGEGVCVSGPGHQAVFEAKGRQFIAFHAWATTPDCRKDGRMRTMYIAPLHWVGGVPKVGASLGSAQPRVQTLAIAATTKE